jgi:hypothetical protein
MHVILEGSLRHFPAGELLAFLCGRGGSGTVDIEAAGKRARIFFRDGRIIWAESNQPSANITEALVETFGWETGKFAVLDSADVPAGVTPVSLDVQQLLEEIRRRRERYRDDDVLRVVDDPAVQQQVSLSAGEFKVLFKIGAGRAFADLQREAIMPPEELLVILQKLRGEGLISVARDTAPVPVAATTKVPALQIGDDTDVNAKAAPKPSLPTLVGSLTPDMNPDQSYPLLEPEYTIGRAPDNDIVLADSSVSSKHAKIVRAPEGFVVEDLQSRNGTFVNGEKVAERRQLADSDILRLGKVLLTFNVASESSPKELTQPEVHL